MRTRVDEARGGKGERSMTRIATGDRALETTDELADTSPPDTFPEFVLREKSRACKRRFKECLYVPNLPHDDWLEQRMAEFNWWTSGLNADKNGPGSLDARLRLRPDVTTVIVDALDGLEDALYTYHELATSDPPLPDEEDPPGLTEADDDSTASDGADRAPSPWSDMSSGSGEGPASAVGDGEEEDEETEVAENQHKDVHSPLSRDTYAEQRVYIENNLEVLIRIHTAIKLSGLKFRNKRADDALRQAEQEHERQKLTLGAHKALAGQAGEHERFRRYLTKLVLRNGYTEDLMRGLSFRIYQLAEAERCQDVRESRDLEDSQDPERSQDAGESDGGQIRESYEVLLQKKLLVVLRAYLCDAARLTTVQRRLIDANIVRRNRLAHAGSASKTPSHAREGRSQHTPQIKPLTKSIAQRSSLMAGNVAPSSSNLVPSPASRPATQSKQSAQATKSFVAQPATALDSRFSITGALTPALRSTARSAGTKMSARVGHLDYPSCPMSEDDPFPCDYCPMMLPQDYKKKEKWRGHVAQDLCGYVCVFEDCESPEDMFASTYEWMSHMARSHSEVEWVCPLCAKHRLPDAADDVQAASFPDPSQLKDHILACHPATDAAADLTELELVVSAGQRTVGIRKVRCPLCRPGLVTSDESIDGSAVPPLPVGQAAGLVQLEEDQHVATHIHEFALHAFPSADGEELPEEARKSLSSKPSTHVDIKFEGPRIPEGSLQGQAFAYTLENIQGVIEELKATFLQVQASDWIQAGSSVRLDIMAARLDNLIPTHQLAQGEVDLDGFARGLNDSLVLVSQLGDISPNPDEERPQIIELLEELDESLRQLPSLFEAGRRREGPEPGKGEEEEEEEEEAGRRFERTGSMVDLNRAVDIASQAVDTTPQDNPNRASQLNNLGTWLGIRFERTGSMEDLDRAIDTVSQAIAATRQDNPDRAGQLNNLGTWLGMRFEQTYSIEDLYRAIDIISQAIDTTHQDNPNLAIRINNLGNWFGIRFKQTGSIEDLDRTIDTISQAVDATPQDNPNRAGQLNNLGTWLGIRFELTGSMDDLNRQLSLYREGWHCKTAPPSIRIRCAQQAAHILASQQDWKDSSQLLQEAVDLLPTVSPRSLKHTDKQHILAESADLVSAAVASSINTGKDASYALQLLELGRVVIAGLLMDIRGEISDLKQEHPSLANEFISLRDELDSPTDQLTSSVSSENISWWESQAKQRREANKNFSELITSIRAQPGFDSFLRPPATEELMAIANPDPIIVINLSSYRCDAFLVERDQIRVLELPGLTVEEVYKRVLDLRVSRGTGSFQAAPLLEWLWDIVARPSLEALGFNDPVSGDNWPRVWWIPTGLLSQLPLHAAGYHASGRSETVLDRVMSSYASSIKALIHGRQHHVRGSGPLSDRALLVAMRETPDLSANRILTFATDEVEMLKNLCPSLHLRPITPTLCKDNILGYLQSHKIFHFASHGRSNPAEPLQSCRVFHFAGHGHSNPAEPLQSCLLLEDWKTNLLTVGDLRDHWLRGNAPFLGYLSVCSTGANEAAGLANEGIHLVSAFQLAGFRHVVGTLWEVSDKYRVDVARVFYETMRDEGMTDTAVCRGLHRAVRALRDGGIKKDKEARNAKLVSLGTQARGMANPYWVPYVHFGV